MSAYEDPISMAQVLEQLERTLLSADRAQLEQLTDKARAYTRTYHGSASRLSEHPVAGEVLRIMLDAKYNC